MSHFYTIFATFVATCLALASSAVSFGGQHSEIGLLNFMARSNDLMQQDPTRSLDCFNKYIPLINEIASNYETNFQACLNQSETSRVEADDGTLRQRTELANAAEASCNLLKQCPENPTAEGVFECYMQAGSGNIKTMYMIDANASQHVAELRERYYLIRNVEYKCTNDTKRAYEKQSAAAYAGLNNCILGNDETTSTTTVATTTSTEPETSQNPETTQSPLTTVPDDTTTTTTPAATTTTTETTTEEATEAVTSDSSSTTESPEENTTENPQEE